MLFCIAEEAKPISKLYSPTQLPRKAKPYSKFVRKAINHEYHKDMPGPFFLVESKVNPKDSEKFKQKLKDDDAFESDFISASEEDCQE